MRPFFLLISLFICSCETLVAQEKPCVIAFIPQFNGEKLIEGTWYRNGEEGDSIKIDLLRFYISNIAFYKGKHLVKKLKDPFFLVDLSDPRSFQLQFKLNKKINFNKICFDIGIDSTTNVAGALSGNLDPTKGMYWAWQSGYINFKLEGSTKNNQHQISPFQFHIGGYQAPYYALQHLEYESDQSLPLAIEISIEKIINSPQFKSDAPIMSPGKRAFEFSKMMAEHFNQAK